VNSLWSLDVFTWSFSFYFSPPFANAFASLVFATLRRHSNNLTENPSARIARLRPGASKHDLNPPSSMTMFPGRAFGRVAGTWTALWINSNNERLSALTLVFFD